MTRSIVLLPAQEFDVSSVVTEGRIRLDGAGTAGVISFVDSSPQSRTMHSRVLIEGASVSEVLTLASPDDESWPVIRSRLLIGDAQTSQLLELSAPRLGDAEG